MHNAMESSLAKSPVASCERWGLGGVVEVAVAEDRCEGDEQVRAGPAGTVGGGGREWQVDGEQSH